MSTRAKQEMAKMIRIDDDVHEKLTRLGLKNESYSDVVRKLIDFYEKHGAKK